MPWFTPPAGISVLFTSGVNTICYYASKAKRVFVSNAGTIGVIALSSYFFPRRTATVFGGVVASHGATWIARRVDEVYHVHFADIADWLLRQMPMTVQRRYAQAVSIPARPMRMINNYAQTHQVYLLNDNVISELVAPVVEELIYRYTGQELLARGMMALGVPRSLAYMVSGSIAASLFAAGHNPDPRNPHYREALIAGMVFGVVMHCQGLPMAMLAHSGYNVARRLRDS